MAVRSKSRGKYVDPCPKLCDIIICQQVFRDVLPNRLTERRPPGPSLALDNHFGFSSHAPLIQGFLRYVCFRSLNSCHTHSGPKPNERTTIDQLESSITYTASSDSNTQDSSRGMRAVVMADKDPTFVTRDGPDREGVCFLLPDNCAVEASLLILGATG